MPCAPARNAPGNRSLSLPYAARLRWGRWVAAQSSLRAALIVRLFNINRFDSFGW
jgi:hypothetical protein